MTEHTITLVDLDDWDRFVIANGSAIIDQYGTIANALRHLRDGGLTLGGGAAPIFNIVFDDCPD